MAHVSDLIAQDILEYLKAHEHKGLLRFITCGSVDDGKSTLIGRLLYESKMLFEDQLAALEADSKKVGTQGGDLDFALLVDGLTAEREQGITIDVAYRFFSTDRRKFIVADTPGHEQYTRNMITGASTAQVAIVMIDGRKGVLTQTRRHSYLVSLIGIRKIVLAVNKLDMVGYSKDVFDKIEADYRAFAAQIGLSDITCIPMSALKGDNVTGPSQNTPWYSGPSLMHYLETVEIEENVQHAPFRMPVQWVNRPNLDFRGFSGLIVGGTVKPGDKITVLPSAKQSEVARIVTLDGDLPLAVAGQSVTVTLRDEIDISRGDVIVAASSPSGVADQFEATVVWMSEQPMEPGKAYLLKIGSRMAGVTLRRPRYKVNVNTLEQSVTQTLELNEIGVCDLVLDRPVAFDPYESNRDMGGFILIDRLLNTTVAAGLVRKGERRTQEVNWSSLVVNPVTRAALKGQKACVVWIKQTTEKNEQSLAALIEKLLYSMGRHSALVDSASLASYGFSPVDGVQSEKLLGAVAKALVDAGLIVIVTSTIAESQERAKDACEIVLQAPFSPNGAAGYSVEISGKTPQDAAELVVARLRALGALEAIDQSIGGGI